MIEITRPIMSRMAPMPKAINRKQYRSTPHPQCSELSPCDPRDRVVIKNLIDRVPEDVPHPEPDVTRDLEEVEQPDICLRPQRRMEHDNHGRSEIDDYAEMPRRMVSRCPDIRSPRAPVQHDSRDGPEHRGSNVRASQASGRHDKHGGQQAREVGGKVGHA